ncbi:hypothetical protein TUMEXPCC7403_23525 [Tumidithrix helvetica PCC 7403]
MSEKLLKSYIAIEIEKFFCICRSTAIISPKTSFCLKFQFDLDLNALTYRVNFA